MIDRPMQEWSRIFRIQSRCYGYKVEYNRNQELVYVPDFVSRIDRFNPTSAVICHQKVFSKFWPTIWVNTTLAFLKHPEKFPEDYDKVPYNYIRFHTDEVIERIVADDDVEALEALINLLGKKVDLQLIDEIIEQAGDRVNIRHYMIDLKNRKYSKKEQEKLRSILEEKELGIRELTVAEWKKLWAYKKLDNGGIVLTGYKGDEENLIVPARIGKTPVTAIGDHVLVPERKRYDSEALARKDRIRTVMIPEGIEDIGEEAFADCPRLESISIPTSLKKLGEGAFSNCHGLADAEGFVIVGGVLFNYYGSNETITIPEGVTRIDSRAFYGNSVIREVIMPEGLKTIGRSTFYVCLKLRKTVMPDGLENIGDEAFGNCKALEKAAVPDSVKEMGQGVFLNCSHLAEGWGRAAIMELQTKDRKPDQEKAYRMMRRAAEAGLASAQVILGLFYMSGIGVKPDYQTGMEWFRKAADQGYDGAVKNIQKYQSADGLFLAAAGYRAYAQKTGTAYPDGYELLTRAIAAGSAEAINMQGVLYGGAVKLAEVFGQTVEKDYEKARACFEKALEIKPDLEIAKNNLKKLEDVEEAERVGREPDATLKWIVMQKRPSQNTAGQA